MIAFVQPFGLSAPGGGPRILRALLEGEHPPVLSICTSVLPAPASLGVEEIHLPVRPTLGRLERTRFCRQLSRLDQLFQPRFERELRRTIRDRQIKLLHVVPHGYDIVGIFRVTEELRLPYVLNVHDDLEYISLGHPLRNRMLSVLPEAWRCARSVFVISEEMGREYSERYGVRDYEVITDGVTSIAERALDRPQNSLRVYFMGLFHFRYAANLRALLDALKKVRAIHPDWEISMTCRCGSIFGEIKKDDVPVTILPFASEADVANDMRSADLLYQPLPFSADAISFGKFSLSTKLVTYLGSGLPILYHGPEDTAACRLLAARHAGVTCTTLDAGKIAKQLMESIVSRQSIVANALGLARERFMLADQQRRFWTRIQAALNSES